MARTLELDTITEPGNSGTANITLSSNTTTTMPLVDINGGAIDSTTLGAGTPSSVAATTLTASGTTTLNGATTMTGDVTLGNASSDTVTVTGTMAGIDNKSGMTGEIRMWGGSSAPTGWLLCDGASVSRSTYAALYAITGDAFGTASGSTFNVPDMRGRMPVGVGTGIGGAAEDADGGSVPVGGSALTARSLGEWSGAEVLSTAQMVAHTHTSAAHTHTGPSHTHTGPSHTHTFTGTAMGTHFHGAGVDVTPVYNTYRTLNVYNDLGTRSSSIESQTSADSAGTPAGTNSASGTGATGASGTGATGSTTPGVTGSVGSTSKFTTPIMCVNFIIKT